MSAKMKLTEREARQAVVDQLTKANAEIALLRERIKKVPVEAIRMVHRIADLARAARAISLSRKEEDAITTLRSWLSAKEEGGK